MKKLLLVLLLFSFIEVKALEVSGESVILMEEGSGRILYSKNINNQKLIASTTKIMTAVLAIESKKLDSIVKVDDSILESYGSNIYIEVNEELSLRDLVYGLMLRSGNDAALAIANYVSESEDKFVELMNKKASEIGMKNTVFCNPHGLDQKCGNISTAYDMALLTRYANSIDEYRKITGTKRYIAKSNLKTYDWYNKNKLLTSYKYTTGGKTGFTEKARRTLVTSASKDNLNLIVVTLNDPNDFLTHKTLYEYGFNNYYNYLVLDKETFKFKEDFYKQELYIKNDFYYPLKENETDNINLKIKIDKILDVKNNDKVGVIEVLYDTKVIHKEDVFIKINKKKENIFDKIKRFFYDK